MRALHLAFGHHRIGLVCGARTGRLLADQIAANAPNADLPAFSADLFAL